MEISSTSNRSFSRSVTPSKGSSDRQSFDQNQTAILESKAQERALEQRAVQEKLQQHKEDRQRRLDGRLISFGHEKDNVASQQKQASFNRSRVNEAYSPPTNEASHKQDNQRSHDSDAIDIVV